MYHLKCFSPCLKNINFTHIAYDLHEICFICHFFRLLLFLFLISFSLYFFLFFVSVLDVACKPPRGNTCIEIRSCPYFSELLNKTPIPRPKNVIKFIKEHQCGFHGNVPKVCCSDKYMNLNNMNGNNILLPYKTFKITNHKNFKLLPKDCGKLSDDFRITGGTKASLLEFPWMALIAYDTGNTL